MMKMINELKQSRDKRLQAVEELAAEVRKPTISWTTTEEENEEIIKGMWQEAFEWLAAFEAKNSEN